MIALASEWIRCKDESGNPDRDRSSDAGDMFCNFARRVLGKYGYVTTVYADSAEQTLIRWHSEQSPAQWSRMDKG